MDITTMKHWGYDDAGAFSTRSSVECIVLWVFQPKKFGVARTGAHSITSCERGGRGYRQETDRDKSLGREADGDLMGQAS